VRALGKLTFTELKLFAREPSSAVFILGLPLLLLVANGTIGSSVPPEAFGGVRYIDVVAPMMLTTVLAILAFSTLPAVLAGNRELGVLRRMAVTPVHPVMLLLAQLLVHLLVAVVGLAVVLAVAAVGYGLSLPPSPVTFAAAWALGALSLFALGFVIAALLRTSRSTSAVGTAVAFPMLMVSGAMFPREFMAEPVRRIGDLTPLSPVVRMLRDTWAGAGFSLAGVLVLVAMAAVSTGVAARWFRWE
jgi:ABC-2 type transport system permease protein